MRKIFGLVLALALVAAACGGDSGPDPADDPKGALQAALDRLAEYEGVSLTMSIASDTASLVAASEGDLTEDNAQRVIDSSITLSAVSSEDPTNSQFQLAANIAGIDNAFEMRAADNTLFLRADVSGLAEAFGADTSQLDSFESEAGAAPGFEFVGPALDGEWIGLTGLDTAMDQLGGATGGIETPSEEDLAAIKRFTDALGDAAEVTAGDKEGPGDHVVATVNLREAYTSLSEIAGTLIQVPGSELPPESEVPDKDISVDVWIDGGNLTQAELDLTQMADLGDSALPEGVDHLAFRIGIEEFTGGVEAPDGATEVDLMQIFSGLLGGGVPGMDTGESSEVPMDICAQLADQLEGQPQEVIDQVLPQFEAECPDLADQLGQ